MKQPLFKYNNDNDQAPANARWLILILVLAAGLSSCKTAEQIKRAEPEPELEADTARVADEPVQRENELAAYRNALGDVYTVYVHDMPEAFLRNYEQAPTVERNPFDGYRIQIISTRNVAMADSTARKFRVWADTTLAGHIPEAYVQFQQPYYKVQVGDFHDRDRANRFSRMVKRQFPDAWVVHDQVNPSLVPADSVEIGRKPVLPDSISSQGLRMQ